MCKFCHLLEKHQRDGVMLETGNLHLQENGGGSPPARSWSRPSSMRPGRYAKDRSILVSKYCCLIGTGELAASGAGRHGLRVRVCASVSGLGDWQIELNRFESWV